MKTNPNGEWNNIINVILSDFRLHNCIYNYARFCKSSLNAQFACAGAKYI